MKRSEFADTYERLLREAHDAGIGVDVSTMAERAGSSRQRAYAWLKQNHDRLVVVGRGETGAELWAMPPDAPAGRR